MHVIKVYNLEKTGKAKVIWYIKVIVILVGKTTALSKISLFIGNVLFFLVSYFKDCVCQLGAAMATALQHTVSTYWRNYNNGNRVLYYINAKSCQALEKFSFEGDNCLIRLSK